MPITSTHGQQLSFILQPFNYFDGDPSQESSDNVQVETDSDGRFIHRSVDNSKEMDCLPVMAKPSSGAYDYQDWNYVTGITLFGIACTNIY